MQDINEGDKESEIQEISKQDIMEELLGENDLVSLGRKRFVTNEQKVRSVVGIRYNISLNYRESDMSDDPEQEDEVNCEIEELRNKI